MKKILHIHLAEGDVRLRLTVGAQKRLKAYYNCPVLDTITGAMEDVDILTRLLTEALTWEGSGNMVTDGDQLYDLLVDNGYSGNGDFGCLAIDIAAASGLLTETHASRIKAKITKSMEGLFEEDDVGNDAYISEDESRPTKAAELN